METRNKNEPHKFRLALKDKLNLKDPNKNMALADLSIYYTWKRIKSAYNNNKFIIFAVTRSDDFDCLMDHTLFQTLKIILKTIKSMKLQQIILLCKFMSIKSKIGLFSKIGQAINWNYYLLKQEDY